jgi:hypothetical protein
MAGGSVQQKPIPLGSAMPPEHPFIMSVALPVHRYSTVFPVQLVVGWREHAFGGGAPASPSPTAGALSLGPPLSDGRPPSAGVSPGPFPAELEHAMTMQATALGKTTATHLAERGSARMSRRNSRARRHAGQALAPSRRARIPRPFAARPPRAPYPRRARPLQADRRTLRANNQLRIAPRQAIVSRERAKERPSCPADSFQAWKRADHRHVHG